MGNLAICSIIAKNYIAHARCLMNSFLEHNPGGRAFVLIVDTFDGYIDPEKEDFEIIRMEEVGILDFESMSFQYTVLELATAVKPFLLEYLFDQYDLEKLCYFDPDILIFSQLDDLEKMLDEANIVLTPHLLSLLEDDRQPGEMEILQAGAYNLGFIGLSHKDTVRQFLRWWQGKLRRHAGIDFAHGLFTDQRWVDLVPGLFPNVMITRDPGYNVAYWNLKTRQIKARGAGYVVENVPLKFFHFSGFSVDNAQAVSKYQNRFALSDLPEHVIGIFNHYQNLLLENNIKQAETWPYTYQCFDDGVRIPDIVRVIWREETNQIERWGSPYNTDRPDNFRQWLNEPDSPGPGFTRLALRIYNHVRFEASVPHASYSNSKLYAAWLVNSGQSILELDDIFLAPIRQLLKPQYDVPITSQFPLVRGLMRLLDFIGIGKIARRMTPLGIRIELQRLAKDKSRSGQKPGTHAALSSPSTSIDQRHSEPVSRDGPRR